jgi:2-amino-4-hydroxy-6-hydroxymethyldihydropteridine diphosphokinase
MNRAFISLGSNIDKEANMPAAVGMLQELCYLVAVSTVYETLPMGLPDQPNFFNLAVLVETTLRPTELKSQVLDYIEQTLERVRTSNRNAPRTIDVDLTLFNEDVLDYNGHHIPDPDLVRFAHVAVAVPIADIAPELHHPETGEKMKSIAVRLSARAAKKYGVQVLWPRRDINPLP